MLLAHASDQPLAVRREGQSVDEAWRRETHQRGQRPKVFSTFPQPDVPILGSCFIKNLSFPSFHDRSCSIGLFIPDAIRSVLTRAATDVIQLGWLLELLIPWAAGTLQRGFFFWDPHKESILTWNELRRLVNAEGLKVGSCHTRRLHS